MKHDSFESITRRLLNLSNAVLVASLAFAISACQRSEFDSKAAPSTTSDMSKAAIALSGDPVADGLTPISIYIWLRNYKGEPLSGLHVEIEVSGSGNSIVPCTITDSEGKATCGLITTVAEKKNVMLKGTDKWAPATFTAPREVKDGGAFVAAGDRQIHSSGAVIVSSLGFMGPFEGRDAGGNTRLRSTNLGAILAEVP